MRKYGAVALISALLLTGCATQSDAEKEQQMAADIWAAGDHEGPMPAHDTPAVLAAIKQAVATSERIISDGSSASQCTNYKEVATVLSLSFMKGERLDYIRPISEDLGQIVASCETNNWAQAMPHILSITELGGEYVRRFG